MVVYSTVFSDADQRKHQSSASLAFVRGIHRRPVNSPHKWPVTRKTFSFDDVFIACAVRGVAKRSSRNKHIAARLHFSWGNTHAYSNHIRCKVWDENIYPFPNSNDLTVEDRDWTTNFIPHFIEYDITYPPCDLSYSMLVQGTQGHNHKLRRGQHDNELTRKRYPHYLSVLLEGRARWFVLYCEIWHSFAACLKHKSIFELNSSPWWRRCIFQGQGDDSI